LLVASAEIHNISIKEETRKMPETGMEIKDYLGSFIADHVELSAGRVALQISSREIEILGESLVRDIVAWAMGSKDAPYTAGGEDEADFLAEVCLRPEDGGDEDRMSIRFTPEDAYALGQLFAVGVLEWVRSIQIARHRSSLLTEAILAKQAELAAEHGPAPEDDSDREPITKLVN
jgi:hypothetical protein